MKLILLQAKIGKTAVALLLILVLSPVSTPQGACLAQDYGDISGYAGSDAEGPGGNANWQASVLQFEAQVGPVGCTYQHFIDDPYTGIGHWYGHCTASAYLCPPRVPAETIPGAHCNTSGAARCGQPIDLTSGNTFIQQTDLTLPGLGNLALVRTWNSIWPSSQSTSSSGLFGSHWRSTYEERMFVDYAGVVKYSRADGTFWSFYLYDVSPPKYKIAAPADQSVSLQYSTTQWTLTFKNGEKRLFDATSGSLTTIVDRNGNSTQLGYDSLNRLVSVTDPVSRHLYFTYASGSSRLITGLTSDVGLSLSYAYDTQGRLTQVTKPDQTTVSFEYDSNSLISAVKDTVGKLLESHTYDGSGRGLTSSRAGGVEALSVAYPQ